MQGCYVKTMSVLLGTCKVWGNALSYGDMWQEQNDMNGPHWCKGVVVLCQEHRSLRYFLDALASLVSTLLRKSVSFKVVHL